MRYTDLFGKTRRDAPAEISDPARRLVFRAGLMRPVDGGAVVYLPLATRVLLKMKQALNADLTAWGGQLLHVTGEFDLSALAAQEIQSYKHLAARVVWLDAGGTRAHVAALEATSEAAIGSAVIDILEARGKAD